MSKISIDDNENEKKFKRKQLYPIVSIEQVVNSYYIAKAILKIRGDLDNNINEVGLDNLPKIDVEVPDLLFKLYEETALIFKFNKYLVYMLKFAIEDMFAYNFSEDPSVNAQAQADTSHLKQYFGSTFTTLSKINLMDHTINVFEEAVKMAKIKGRSSGIAIPLLSALLHDFGKSTAIREKLDGAASSRGVKAHAEVSSTYVKELLVLKMYEQFTDIPIDTINLIAECVKNHHTSNLKQKTDQSIAFVVDADHLARKKEYNYLIKLQNK